MYVDITFVDTYHKVYKKRVEVSFPRGRLMLVSHSHNIRNVKIQWQSQTFI